MRSNYWQNEEKRSFEIWERVSVCSAKAEIKYRNGYKKAAIKIRATKPQHTHTVTDEEKRAKFHGWSTLSFQRDMVYFLILFHFRWNPNVVLCVRQGERILLCCCVDGENKWIRKFTHRKYCVCYDVANCAHDRDRPRKLHIVCSVSNEHVNRSEHFRCAVRCLECRELLR